MQGQTMTSPDTKVQYATKRATQIPIHKPANFPSRLWTNTDMSIIPQPSTDNRFNPCSFNQRHLSNAVQQVQAPQSLRVRKVFTKT